MKSGFKTGFGSTAALGRSVGTIGRTVGSGRVGTVAADVESGFTKLLDLCKCTDRGSMGIEHKDWLLSTLCNYGFWIKLKQKYD
ncbi:unnamed protein product [Microthlaspi erraticum]|uniref:Uncharacterized protein n=1 Tax=Microthlaspi erraticum TaxID=1685480 RepID=A0A6D2IUH1_9BRAS|nr:unnamed protein product [Microthlaspi erraticum]